MVVAIIHTDFSKMGGGEKLALDYYNVLKEAGYSPFFLTYTPINNYDYKIIKKKSFLSKLLIYKSVYLKYILNIENALNEAKNYSKNKLIISTTNIDYPIGVDIQYFQNPAFYMEFRNRKGLLRKVYNKLVDRTEAKLKKYGKPRLVLYNSSFTKSKYDIDGPVVYPVAYDEYYLNENKNRKPWVVTLSRLDYDKNIHKIKYIAEPFRFKAKFIIMGRVDPITTKKLLYELRDVDYAMYERYDYSYIHTLFNHIQIYPNARKDFIKYVMSNGLIYLHPPFPEPFGISVVEGITAGLIPVVYKDSGSCIDIVSKIDEGLCYNSIDEAISIIDNYLHNEHDLETIRKRGLEVVKQFNYENFKNGIINALKGMQA